MSARVLVIDDVEVHIRALEAKLSREYFTVLTAGSGAAALQSARSGGPTSCCSTGRCWRGRLRALPPLKSEGPQ
jgi:CheY-like chemotaxis protein